jgi:hypothetical protein
MVAGWSGTSSGSRHRTRHIRDEMAGALVGWTFGSRFAYNPKTMSARHEGKPDKMARTSSPKKGGIAMATKKKAKKTTRKLTSKKMEATKPLLAVGGWNRVKN